MEPKYLFNGANVIKANKSVEARKRDVSPKPVWIPTDPRPNTADILPKFSKTRFISTALFIFLLLNNSIVVNLYIYLI